MLKNKQRITNIVLWIAYLLALAASLKHVAWTFGTLEFAGDEWNGYIAAIALDAGLAALAYAVQQRKRTNRPTAAHWAGIIGFALISGYANLLHAAAVQLNGATPTLSTLTAIDPLAISKALILSATLPALVVYLGEIVSNDDAAAVQAAEAAAKTAARRARRDEAATVQVDGQRNVLDEVNAHRLDDKDAAMRELLSFLDDNPNASLAKAGQAIGRSKSTAGNYIQELVDAGRIHKNGNGWTRTL